MYALATNKLDNNVVLQSYTAKKDTDSRASTNPFFLVAHHPLMACSDPVDWEQTSAVAVGELAAVAGSFAAVVGFLLA